LEKLRCNLCGDVFTATPPEGVGEDKYDETAASMISMLRYGSGFPWNRLEGLPENLGVPLPVATQCEIVAETAVPLQAAMDELIRQAASGAAQRQAREKLLEAARRREIDVVLVWRLDRWGRSVTDLLATLQELNHLGARLRRLNRGIGSDHASQSRNGRPACDLR